MDDKMLKQTTELAEFKFGLISPVINHTYPDKSENAYFKRISQNPITMPNGTKKIIPVATLKTWKRTYNQKGFEGLMQKRRSDRDSSRRIYPELANQIQEIRIKYPKIAATTLLEMLISDGIVDQNEMSSCTMQRFFKKNPINSSNNDIKKDRRAFEAEYVNGIWQADSLYGPHIGSPAKRTYMQAIIDDKSRKIVSAAFYYNDTAINFQHTLKSAISSHGLPSKLFVDNGGPYKNYQLSLICGNLGIQLCHAAVRDGAAKGKIERFNRTFRIKFLNCNNVAACETIEELNGQLSTWINKYNQTIHSSTNKTPTDAFFMEESNIKWFSGTNADLDNIFMNRIERKVANDSTIQINKTLFNVPMEYIGERIEIRWSPGDIHNVYMVCKNNEMLKLSITDKVENSKSPRRKASYQIDYNNLEGDLHV